METGNKKQILANLLKLMERNFSVRLSRHSWRTHLQKRVAEFNGIELSKEAFLEALHERLATTDIESVKQDAARFIFNQRDIEIWSNDYFLKLADMMVFKDWKKIKQDKMVLWGRSKVILRWFQWHLRPVPMIL